MLDALSLLVLCSLAPATQLGRASEPPSASLAPRDAPPALAVAPLQQAYLKASAPVGFDHFGESVAIQGDTLVVGAPDEDSGVTGSGAVTVFVRQAGSWVWQADLKAPGPMGNDAFGASVAVCGDTLVVGVPGEDTLALNSGAACVFVREAGAWSLQTVLKASNADASDAFGASVAIAGDTIVVGAPVEDSSATGVNGIQDDEGAPFSGAAYVFVQSGTTWSQEAYLKASNTGVFDLFGNVAIAGDTVVVAAPGEMSNATGVNGDQTNNFLNFAGAAYVFVRDGTTWSQQAYLKASDSDSFDRFGTSLALDADTLVVGAPEEDSNATGVDGDDADDSATDAGAAYVFVRAGTTWSQEAYLKACNTDPSDQFGRSVALAGDLLVVGAWFEDGGSTGVGGDPDDDSVGNAGAAYVFARSSGAWSQSAYLKALVHDINDRLGTSAALSGTTLALGAHEEDGAIGGVDGDPLDDSAPNSGAAYAFQLSPPAQVATRNAGTNPTSYAATPIVIGTPFTATVDNTAAAQLTSLLFAFESPGTLPLAGGQTLLCLDLGSGELLTGSGLSPTATLSGLDTYSVPVPNDPALCGATLCTQAVQLGNPPFTLSNAQDLTIGSH